MEYARSIWASKTEMRKEVCARGARRAGEPDLEVLRRENLCFGIVVDGEGDGKVGGEGNAGVL